VHDYDPSSSLTFKGKNSIIIPPFTPGRDALLRGVGGILVIPLGNEPKRCPPEPTRQAVGGREEPAASSFTAVAIVSSYVLVATLEIQKHFNLMSRNLVKEKESRKGRG